MTKLGILGLGRMGEALINGVISSGAISCEIYGFDISQERRNVFERMGCRICKDATEVVQSSDIIILSVKPQNFGELFDEIKGSLTAEKLIVSIAAGVTMSRIYQLAGMKLPLIRTMPNNPMIIGKGVTVISPNELTTPQQRELVEKMFSACGRAVFLDETKLNPSITIHSSMPAYIYLLARVVGEYAEQNGIERKTALNMFAYTLGGCADMISNSEDGDMDKLIAAVSSPKGTTVAALEALEAGSFAETFMSGLNACTSRADELAKS